jgi:hypothetical protein
MLVLVLTMCSALATFDAIFAHQLQPDFNTYTLLVGSLIQSVNSQR